MDPWGHLAPFLFKDIISNENGMSIKVPALGICRSLTIYFGTTSRYSPDHRHHEGPHEGTPIQIGKYVFMTSANVRRQCNPQLPELEESVRSGRL